MSLVTNLTSAFTRVATEFKAVYAKVGDLTSLTTTAKGNIVAAINEVNAKPTSTGGAAINDSAASSTTTYSSTKIAQVATDAASGAVNALVSGAPAALDTLKEFADAIGNDASFANTTTTALGNRLRFDAAQTLTSGQKTQGIANLGAIAASDVGDPTTDFVAAFNAALA